MNNWLENRVKSLEEELENSKTDFEILYKNSFCKCDTLICENCENLEKKVSYLVKTVDKLSKGKFNFENVLASQNCVFGKDGLGFNPLNKQDKFSKSFSKLPEKQPIVLSKQPVVTCFYCMKDVILSDSIKLGNILFLKALRNAFLKLMEFPVLNVNQKDPHLKGDQIFVLEISLCREI